MHRAWSRDLRAALRAVASRPTSGALEPDAAMAAVRCGPLRRTEVCALGMDLSSQGTGNGACGPSLRLRLPLSTVLESVCHYSLRKF